MLGKGTFPVWTSIDDFPRDYHEAERFFSHRTGVRVADLFMGRLPITLFAAAKNKSEAL